MAVVGALAEGPGIEAYLQIDGVRGDVTEVHHQDWIRVNGFRDETAVGPTDRSPVFNKFCLIKATDRATPLLLQQCASGTHLPRARLELIRGENQRLRFYTITLSNVVVTSLQASGIVTEPIAPLTEEVCLTFSGIEWTYIEFDRSGLPAMEIQAWWDRITGSGNVATVPVFKVTGVKTATSGLDLTWPARAGRAYRILGSSVVTGPYELIQTVVPVDSGPANLLLPFTSDRRFVVVEESE